MFTVRNVTIGEGKPKLSVTLRSADLSHLMMDAKLAFDSPAEIIEWRADLFQDFMVPEHLLKAISTIRSQIGKKVLLFTLRTKEEGGSISLKDAEYIGILKQAVESGMVDLIDVECCVSEYRALEVISLAKKNNVYVLGSNVSTGKMLSESEMDFRIRYMQRLGADFARLSVFPGRKKETYKLLNVIYSITNNLDFPASIIGEGQEGKMTLALSEFFGNAIVFTELDSIRNPEVLDVRKANLILTALHEL